MNLILKTSFIIMSTAFMISCSGSDAAGPNLDPGSGGSGSSGGSGGVDSPLHIEVKINYIGSTQKTSVGTCTVPKTAPFGTTVNCSMQIPELNMYYSDYEFLVSTNSRTTCRYISFAPYMFRRSESDVFADASGTAVDCALAEDTVCWGGAAKHIVSKAGYEFPKQATGLYFLTATSLQQSYKMDAPDTTRSTDNHVAAYNNTVVANNLSTPGRATNISNTYVDYVAGSMRDYTYECRDAWADLAYRIVLRLGDDDQEDLPNQTLEDQLWDWTGL